MTDEREMTINLSDNTAVKCVDVIIDGKSVGKLYAQKEIEKAGGKISYMIEGASEPQKIEASSVLIWREMKRLRKCTKCLLHQVYGFSISTIHRFLSDRSSESFS